MATPQEREAFLRGWHAAMEEALAVLATEAGEWREEEAEASESGAYKLPGSFALEEVQGSFRGRQELLAWWWSRGIRAHAANHVTLPRPCRAVRGRGVAGWPGDRADARRRLLGRPSIRVDFAVSRHRGPARRPGFVPSVHTTSSNPDAEPETSPHAAAHSFTKRTVALPDWATRTASRRRARRSGAAPCSDSRWTGWRGRS